MKYDIDVFYKHYGYLIDPMSTVLDLNESYAYVKSYLWNIIYTLFGMGSQLYTMDVLPYCLSVENGRYLKVTVSGLILYHFDEDLVDPINEIMDKYPLLKSFFEFNGRQDFNKFVYEFRISSYQSLQQLDMLIKLMQRRDT